MYITLAILSLNFINLSALITLSSLIEASVVMYFCNYNNLAPEITNKIQVSRHFVQHTCSIMCNTYTADRFDQFFRINKTLCR